MLVRLLRNFISLKEFNISEFDERDSLYIMNILGMLVFKTLVIPASNEMKYLVCSRVPLHGFLF